MSIATAWCSRGLAAESLDGRPWVIVDTETTGLNVVEDVLREFSALVLDERCAAIAAIHHWRAENGPEELDALAHALRPALDVGIMVAHNLDFDLAFLRRHESVANSPVSRPARWICTMRASGAYTSLDTLADRCGVELRGRHTAVGDAEGLGAIMTSLCAAAREHHKATIDGIRRIATLRCQGGDDRLSEVEGNPWESLLGRLPRVSPVPFPTIEQRAVVAAVGDRLDSTTDEVPDPGFVSDLVAALLAARISAISLESLLVEANFRQIDT